MNDFDISTYGVEEMTNKDVCCTNGGGFWGGFWAGALIDGAVMAITGKSTAEWCAEGMTWHVKNSADVGAQPGMRR